MNCNFPRTWSSSSQKQVKVTYIRTQSFKSFDQLHFVVNVTQFFLRPKSYIHSSRKMFSTSGKFGQFQRLGGFDLVYSNHV